MNVRVRGPTVLEFFGNMLLQSVASTFEILKFERALSQQRARAIPDEHFVLLYCCMI